MCCGTRGPWSPEVEEGCAQSVACVLGCPCFRHSESKSSSSKRQHRCLLTQARSSARQRLASCSDSRCLSSPVQVLGRFHYRRPAVHTSTRDTGNLRGDRCGASGYAISPKDTSAVTGCAALLSCHTASAAFAPSASR